MKTKPLFLLFLGTSILFSCAQKIVQNNVTISSDTFTIAFGSCNKQKSKNLLWKEVIKHQPNLWIWGGDNIYSDTDNMEKMKRDYADLFQQKGYAELLKTTPIMATWDDHDYGLNDGGAEFSKKDEAQQLFLDFLEVPKKSPRRKQKGVYTSQLFQTPKGSVHVIVLDTRYFRTGLTKSKSKEKRYTNNYYGEGTILGKKQWQWLERQLHDTKATFTIIVSSIQFLSAEHGFETWGNFPHEVDRLKDLIADSKAKRVVLLSGDRHISEFSKIKDPRIPYPIIDFTSSGLTHSYTGFTSEENPYRIQQVVSKLSFGVLKFDFEHQKIIMQMRGIDNVLQQEYIQSYP
jgi:alkaline phosphatase D